MSSAIELIADIVARGQADGSFREEMPPLLAAMVFYGAVEQVIWLDVPPLADDDAHRDRQTVVVDVVCGEAAYGGCRAHPQRRAACAPASRAVPTYSNRLRGPI